MLQNTSTWPGLRNVIGGGRCPLSTAHQRPEDYQNDRDSVFRLFNDTIKGGDFRSPESNVYRLPEVSGLGPRSLASLWMSSGRRRRRHHLIGRPPTKATANAHWLGAR
jgi:hypothetical protein